MSKIRFSFDIGTNSIGWAVWRTGDGVFGADTALELARTGVLIFKDGRNPKDGQSLATMRRVPKQSRKRRDRFVLRRADLMKALVTEGLMPIDENDARSLAEIDPYFLRAKGLDEPLTPHEFGRVLFHLNQRRGFRSNRKADRKDNEKGKIAEGSERLRALLDETNSRTLGEFLWSKHRGTPRTRQATRIRVEGKGAKSLYAFYPTREMIRAEFGQLWVKQAGFAPERYTEALRDRLATIIFRQRDLKPPKIGVCTFEPSEKRLPKALPSVEARGIYERLAHLRLSTGAVSERPLTKSERDVIASALMSGKNLTFKALRKALKIPAHVRINFEEAGETGIDGAATAKFLSKRDHYGPGWLSLTFEQKDRFLAKLLDEADEDRLIERLSVEDGLTNTAAQRCATIPLADGYGRLGSTANREVLHALIREADAGGHVVTYADAVRLAGERIGRPWHHSDARDGEIMDRLPYYGRILQRHILPGSGEPDEKDEAARWGRIMDPSVHIGLNQLRKVVNGLVAEFGHPDQIAVELARELKLNREQKERLDRENRANRSQNEKRASDLAKLRERDTPENRVRLRLFEEQARANDGVAQCPYTGRTIGIAELFSADIEIDHVLPVSLTLDDSLANRVLCRREANRQKRRQTPFQAFGSSPDWPDILARVAHFPPNKRWRFKPDALERFGKQEDFLARQLNETKHLSRLAKIYLGKICDPDRIWVTPGTLTGLLRGKWGLNSVLSDDNFKNRADHRHHAIDAVVIGALTRGVVQRIAHEAARAEERDLEKVFTEIPTPFDDFRDHVRDRIRSVTVSYKPEHGREGALHEDTSYGLVPENDPDRALGNVVLRKPLKGLTLNEVERIRDRGIRTKLRALADPFLDASGKVADAKGFAQMLEAFAGDNGIRRIRVLKPEASIEPILDRKTGKPYRAVTPGENHHVDIVQMRDGSWRGFAASVFEVNRPGWRPQWERDRLGGKLVMRLHKGDLVEVQDSDGERRIKVVHRIEISANRIRLAAHNEGGKLQERHADPDDRFRWDLATIPLLKERNCRALKIDSTGCVSPKRTNVK
ncbi:type II CRISPR RNA-guided endonuclease Cas9 [Pinisolibacter sp.]|uniref:type II CRISPR RNA-guided endonuclease Cas9 n=1 Tax=Pinisolibacter sp. TaxID=2172024 RepID=UPI002FDD52DA